MRAQQPTVIFKNNVQTKVTDPMGEPVEAGNTFTVGLYAAPDGVSVETALVLLAKTNFFAPGLFAGGNVVVPFLAPGDFATFQVRVWETAFGNSYEAAASAPPANGQTARIGKSALLRGRTSPPLAPPQDLPAFGLQSFVVSGLPVPSLSVYDIVVSEGTNGTKNAVFTVSILPSAPGTVTVDFATSDGSALAGSDYVATNGTISFFTGQMTNTFQVILTADVAAEVDEDFFVQLSNVTGAQLSRPLARALITEVRVSGISVDVAITFNSLTGHSYAVERSDDFISWTPVVGAESVAGTGNLTTVYDRGGGCQPNRLYRARLLD